MTQSLITATAAACRAFRDHADKTPAAVESYPFLQAWHDARASYEAMVTGCPTCDPGDPGDPPPPL